QFKMAYFDGPANFNRMEFTDKYNCLLNNKQIICNKNNATINLVINNRRSEAGSNSTHSNALCMIQFTSNPPVRHSHCYALCQSTSVQAFHTQPLKRPDLECETTDSLMLPLFLFLQLIAFSMAKRKQLSDVKKQEQQPRACIVGIMSIRVSVTPQRSNSLDYLNFEEKRQIIASSLSLSDFLHHGPAAAAAAAKGVAATKVIVGEYTRSFTFILYSCRCK
ncbi:hypothetical protein L9F63_002338, partial [Diploptera punctata]